MWIATFYIYMVLLSEIRKGYVQKLLISKRVFAFPAALHIL